jgi:hypothetical protein
MEIRAQVEEPCTQNQPRSINLGRGIKVLLLVGAVACLSNTSFTRPQCYPYLQPPTIEPALSAVAFPGALGKQQHHSHAPIIYNTSSFPTTRPIIWPHELRINTRSCAEGRAGGCGRKRWGGSIYGYAKTGLMPSTIASVIHRQASRCFSTTREKRTRYRRVLGGRHRG